MTNRPSQIASVYVDVVKAFLKRADVQNGKLISYHDNQDPNGNLRDENWVNLGNALVTTGFCVSVSAALLQDKIFNILLDSRKALAKLVSIDIKEQFYGVCKPSHAQNKWHTAILVQDSGVYLIIDMTCAQFGNAYNNKLVWDVETWLRTFQSPVDKHIITGFDGTEISVMPVKYNRQPVGDKSLKHVELFNALRDLTTINDAQRDMFADFLLEGIHLINKKLEIGNITDNDITYMDGVNEVIQQHSFTRVNTAYSVLEFQTKEKAIKWIKKFAANQWKLPHYMVFTKELNTNWNKIDTDFLYKPETPNSTTYVILQAENSYGFSMERYIDSASIIIPHGMMCSVNPEIDILNACDIMEPTNHLGIREKLNTLIIKINVG